MQDYAFSAILSITFPLHVHVHLRARRLLVTGECSSDRRNPAAGAQRPTHDNDAWHRMGTIWSDNMESDSYMRGILSKD